MSKFFILWFLVSAAEGKGASDVTKYVFGTGIQASLLSSFLPCLAVRYWAYEKLGIQGMVTALSFSEGEGFLGTEKLYYVGVREFGRIFKEITGYYPVALYIGLGVGYREEKRVEKEEEKGIGAEIFTGIEWYLANFFSINTDFGVRYSPSSVVGAEWRVGLGGGGTLYFFYHKWLG